MLPSYYELLKKWIKEEVEKEKALKRGENQNASPQ